jgi:hypothetical protein
MFAKVVDFGFRCQNGGAISFRGRERYCNVTRIRIFEFIKRISGFQNRAHRVFQIVHDGGVGVRESERKRFTSRINVKTKDTLQRGVNSGSVKGLDNTVTVNISNTSKS